MENTNKSFIEQLKETEDTLTKEIVNEKEKEKEKVEEVKKEEAQVAKTLLQILIKESADSEHPVTQEMIDNWKGTYGKIYAVRFDEKDFCIFRYLTRTEYKAIVARLSKITGATEDMMDEDIFDKCVLYPSITKEYKMTLPAGTIPTVSGQIRLASNFLPDAVAYDMITKL